MYLGLLLLWIILNGRITLEIVLFGIVICAALYAFCCRILGFSTQQDIRMMKLVPLVMQYLVILMIEIFKANRQVLPFILTKQLEAEPQLVRFKSCLKSETSWVILANSITLTPGTITVKMEDGEFWVHCLDKEFAQGMEDSIFVELLKKMEAVK